MARRQLGANLVEANQCEVDINFETVCIGKRQTRFGVTVIRAAVQTIPNFFPLLASYSNALFTMNSILQDWKCISKLILRYYSSQFSSSRLGYQEFDNRTLAINRAQCCHR